MSVRVLYSHMYVQHVVLAGFVVIVVIILTLWCNTLCFCTVVISANDPLNILHNYS
jgi:hypothetical protein